jgi:hypothetical protein
MQTPCEDEVSTETNPITDAELIRYLDGELDAGTRSALDQRLASAPEAAARLATLRRRSRALSQLMRAANPSGPATRASADAIRPQMVQRQQSPWIPLLRIAAVIAVLLIGIAVPPVRAWLVAHLPGSKQTSTSNNPSGSTSASASNAATSPTADVVYNFTVTADTFDLEVTQSAGTLVVSRSAGGSASAEANAAGTSFLVLPRGLRIEGPASAGAQYTIALPARVHVLRLSRPNGVSLHQLRDGVLVLDLARR